MISCLAAAPNEIIAKLHMIFNINILQKNSILHTILLSVLHVLAYDIETCDIDEPYKMVGMTYAMAKNDVVCWLTTI